MRQGTPAWVPAQDVTKIQCGKGHQHGYLTQRVCRYLLGARDHPAVVFHGQAQEREEVDSRDGASEGTDPHGLEVERLGECEQDVEGEARGRCAKHEVIAEPKVVAAAEADEGKAKHGGECKVRCRGL